MREVFLRIVKFVFGIFLMLIGVIGLILPIMPGWPFIFIGAPFISKRFDEFLKRHVKFVKGHADKIYFAWKRKREDEVV